MPKPNTSGDIIYKGNVIGTLKEVLTYCDVEEICVVPELYADKIWFHSATPGCTDTETPLAYLERDEDSWFGTPIEAYVHAWAKAEGKL